MELEVKCAACGRLLGFYRGEEFWLVALVSGRVEPDVEIWCADCWRARA